MNSKGYSLVEIIVTVSILSILAGGLYFGLGMINNADSEKAAATINNAFAKLRMEAMAKDRQFCITLSKDSDGSYWINSYRTNESGNLWEAYGTPKRLGSRYTIEYTPSSIESQNITMTTGICDSTAPITDTSTILIGEIPIIIIFEKDSGKAKNGAGEYRISGGSRSHVVKLIELTGTHFYE